MQTSLKLLNEDIAHAPFIVMLCCSGKIVSYEDRIVCLIDLWDVSLQLIGRYLKIGSKLCFMKLFKI